jgi:hypothetical protein
MRSRHFAAGHLRQLRVTQAVDPFDDDGADDDRGDRDGLADRRRNGHEFPDRDRECNNAEKGSEARNVAVGASLAGQADGGDVERGVDKKETADLSHAIRLLKMAK